MFRKRGRGAPCSDRDGGRQGNAAFPCRLWKPLLSAEVNKALKLFFFLNRKRSGFESVACVSGCHRAGLALERRHCVV